MGASQSANKTNASKTLNVKNNTKTNAKNNTKKNNGTPVVWNGKVLPSATPAGQKSNIDSNWKPAVTKNARRKTRRNRRNRK
jgi:uncharacterized protein (UPF0333 family)